MMFLAPPTVTPGAEEQLMLGPGGGGPAGGGPPARLSPSVAGAGVGGALNNPPAPRGQTMGSSIGGRS